MVGVEAGQKTAEQIIILFGKKIDVGRLTVDVAGNYAKKVIRKTKVYKIRRMTDYKKHTFLMTGSNLADFIHKKLLELWMKVKLRLIKNQKVIGIIIKVYKEDDYFLQTMTFHRIQIILNVPGLICNNGNKGSVNIIQKLNGFSEHTGKNSFNLSADSLITAQNFNRQLRAFLFCLQETYIFTGSFKLTRNLLGQKRFSASVWTNYQVDLRPFRFFKNRLSPQKGQLYLHVKMFHIFFYDKPEIFQNQTIYDRIRLL